ncbi:BnaC02g22690D [Brassica napus]|uniref:(rape) hypothetical protein n=1 Tax=Brassica napus TaxID=3708 RepID=A0A078HYN0_BRANA|nr:unnamed protein product [Brassica napus]CDY42439.1 BnaC02g22690D [Brassica napus]
MDEEYQVRECKYGSGHRRNDGTYIFNLGNTWEKLQMAAQVIVAIENPLEIIMQSAKPYGQRAILKFSRYTGANAIAGRHNPGIFTNQMQTSFSEPMLLILTDPRTGHQPIKEGALGNIRIIAFRDTDSPMRFVDIGIHANNKGKQIIGCLFWLLARMVLQMCGTIRLVHKWKVVVDLLLYREPEEAKPEDEDEVGQTLDYLLLNMVVETNGPLLRSLMLHGHEKPRCESLLLLPLLDGTILVSLSLRHKQHKTYILALCVF